MNKIFKVVWSKTKECYVVVSEVAKNNGGKKKVLASVLATLAIMGAGAQMGTPVQAGGYYGNSAVNIQPDSIPAGYQGNSVGKNSVAVGYQNTTNNQDGTIAIGMANTATENSAMALGNGNTASGGAATAVGAYNQATGRASVAIGNVSIASAEDSIAIGNRANADKNNHDADRGSGQFSIAVGRESWAKGTDNISIGHKAETNSSGDSIAMGRESKANQANAVAIGPQADANGWGGIAMGREAAVSANFATAIGYKANASGSNSISVGKENNAKAFDAVAIGHNNTSRTYSAVSLGTDNTSDATYGLTDAQVSALPYDPTNNTTLTDPNKTDPRRGITSTIAIGRNNVAGNVETIAIGTNTKATMTDAIAIGARAEATGDYALAIGGAAGGKKVSAAEYGTAVGVRANAAERASAFGAGSNAGAQKSVAIGYTAKASAQKTTSNYEFSGSHGTPSPAGYNTETITINSGSAPSTGAVAGNYYDAGSGVAIGNGATVSDESDRAVVVGPDAKTVGNAHYSVVLGSGSHADASDGFVAGHGSYVESRESIAMGASAHVSGNENIRSQAIGYGATVTGTGAYDATAIGATAQVTGVQGGVALGSGSMLDRTTASNENIGWNSKYLNGTVVRNRAYTATVNSLNDQWDAGAQIGAVSVGNDTQKRQIINVAAGNKDTDAVNVAQLKNVGVRVGADTNIATIGTNKVAADFLAYNGQLNIKGDNNRVTTVSENDANGKDANVNVKFDYDGLVKAKTGSSVTVNQKIEGGKTVFEIDAAAGGATSTESVVKKAATTGDTNIADISVADNKNTGDVGAKYEVSVSRNAVKDAAREAVTVNNGGTTKADGSYTADSNNPISVTPTKDDTNHNTSYAVTFDGNKAAKQIPLTYKANGNGAKTVTLEKGLDFTNGTNTTAEIDNEGVVKYNLNKNVDLSNTGSLTVGGTTVNNGGITIKAPTTPGTTTTKTDVKLTNTGLDNGGNKITNVAEGTNNTDAVNVKQLKENRTEVKAGDNVVVTTDVDATDNHTVYTVNAVTPAVYTTPDGDKLTKDKDGKFHKVGETAEYTGDIITSFENPKAAAGQTTKDGGMIVNNVGSAIKNQTGATYLDKLKAAADDNSKVKNAAVNVSDLKNTADGLTDKGLKFDANEGGVKTNKLGSTVTVQGSGALTAGKAYADEYNTANIRTNIEQGTDGNTKINVGLAKALKDINSISNGTSSITLNSNPGGTNNTPAVQITGGNLSMGNGTTNHKIVNLAPGTADTDAVNVKQLKDTELHITPGTYTPGTDKKVKLTYTDGNGGVVSGKEAVIDLSGLSTGGTTASSWNVKSSANTTDGGAVADTHDANAQNIANGKSVEFQSGKNLVVKQTNDITGGNATVEFSLADNIVAGKDGANGKDGSVGATGKDGSSVVINGADGSIGMTGPKGQNGKDGINGRDGADISMTSAKGEQVLVNRDPAHSADTDKAERIVYVPKDANGDPIKGADGKNIVREVATMDDGLKFAGDDAQGTDKSKVIAKKLNNTVDIIGGADKDKLTNNNIGVNNDNGKLKVQLAKTIDLTKDGSVTTGNTKIDNSGVTITVPTGGATTNVTLTQSGLDNGGNKITNVKAGTADTDAVNVKQLKANRTEVKAGDNVVVTSAVDATDNHTIYTVNAVTPAVYTTPDGTKLTKDKDGKFHKEGETAEYTGDIITSFENPKAATGQTTKDGGMIVNNIGSAIKNQNPTMPAGQTATYLDKLKAAADAGSNVKNAAVNVSDLHSTAEALKASELHIAPTVGGKDTDKGGEGVTPSATAIAAGAATQAYKYNTNTKQVELTFNDGNGNAVTGPKAVIDLSDLANQITSGYTFKTNATENGGKVVNDAATPAAETAVANGGVVNYAAGKNLTVKQDIEKDGTGAATGKQTYTYALADEIGIGEKGQPGVAGKDGVDGKIGVNGKDGSSVVINGKDGSIGMTGPQGQNGKDGINGRDGANISMTSAKGEQVLINRDPAHSADTDKAERIVYVPKDASGNPIQDANGKNIVREVATMDDGLKFTGNNTVIENKQKLGSLVKVQGEGTKEGTTVINPTTGEKELVLSDGTTKFESAKDNIAVVADGTDTLTVKLNKNLKGLDSVQTKTVELGDRTTPDGTTNITYNSGDKRIEYTTPGTTAGTPETKKVATTDDLWTIQGNGTDVAPVGGKVNVKAGENILITTPATADGSMTINAVTPAVYTDKHGNKLTKDKDGKFHKDDGTEVAAADVITSIQDASGNVTGGNSIVNNVGSAIKNAGNAGDSFLTKLDAANTTTPNAAVNVSDLKNTADGLTNKGLKFDANEGGVKTNKLGSTVTVQGSGALTAGKAYADEYNTANIRTKIEQGTDGNTTINVGLAKALKDINSISNGSSSITLNSNPGGTNNTPAVSITGGNVDVGGNNITNLKSGGNTDTNAANIGDVKTIASDTDTHIKPGTYTVAADKTVTMTYVNGKGDTIKENGKDVVAKIDLSGLPIGGPSSTEKVQKASDVAGDKNIAVVTPKAGDTFGDANATYEVSVSRNAVKDAAREAVIINNGGTISGTTYTPNSDNPISVTPTDDGTNHKTTYAITFDGTKAAKQIPLTYKATNGSTTSAAQTVTLDKGLNFTGGDYTIASVDTDGKVVFDVNLGTTPIVTDGKPGVPGQAGAAGKDGIATVKTVVDTINNSGWKANAKANGGTLDGTATATVVKPGNTVNYAAGKNITVKQELETDGAGALTGNQTYTYSLNKNIDVENVHVGINGKDGKIGIDGKDGVDGLDGTNRVDIHVEKGAKGVDGTDGHDGVNGHNGKDGMTRIVYEDKGGKQEVATLNDGLNFTGNNESKTNVQKLNSKVKVQGEGVTENTTSHKLEVNGEEFKSATGNIAVVADGHDTLTVKLNEKLKGLDSVQTKTVELGDHTTPGSTTNITYNPTDKRIEYTTPGTTDTKKVATTDDIWTIQGNGTDVKPVNGKVNVKAGENVVITTPTTADGSMTINAVSPVVYTTPAGDKLTKKSDGKFYKADGSEYTDGDIIASFENPNANSIPAGKLNTTDGGMIVNNIGSAIKTQTPTMPAGTTATYLDKLKAAADDTKTQNAAVNVSDLHNTANALKDSELHIAPTVGGKDADKGGVASGNANPGAAAQAYKYNATTKQVELTFNDGNGKAVTGPKAVIDLSELAGSIQNYGFQTNADGNLKDGTTATATAVASGKTVTYAAGKNLTVEQTIAANGNQTYTYALNKDLTNLDKVVVNGKAGQPGKDGVTITGPKGESAPGAKDGQDGKVGIAGKDGKDAVSISGKDGVGHIGLQGPKGTPGTPGADGASLDISTDHGTQTLVKPEANNDNKSERIVYVPKDKDGNPLKDTDGNVIKREVATMDDGLKFAGDDGTVIKKALGTQLDIIGGATGALSDNNIGVNADNGKLKVQLAKNIDLTKDGSVTTGNTKVNNDGITITKPATATDPAKTVTLTGDGLNNGGNKITNVANGTKDSDAVNVSQLKGSITTVQSSDGSISVTDANAGSTDPTKGHAYDIKINNQRVVEKAQTPVVYTDKDGHKLYKIVDPATGNVTFNTKEDGSGTTVQPNEVIASMNNGDNSTTTPMKLNNVGSSIQKPNSTDTFLKQLDDANKSTPNGAVNVSDLKKTSDALIDKGLVFDANNTEPKTNKLGSKVTIAGTGALANGENFADKYNTDNIRTNITQNPTTGNTTVEIGLNKNLKGLESVSVPGKDGVDGRDGVSITGKDGANGIDGKVGIGKDGKDAVSISGKDGIGHIGLTGAAGKDGKNATADITVKEGKAGVDGKDGITRIVYNDKDGNEHQVATHDDGLKFTGNNESTENKHKLNSVVKVQGEGVSENATSGKLEANGQEFKSATGNIAVVADGDKTLTVKMNKDLNLTKDGSVTMGDTVVNNDGITIKAPTTPGTTDVKLTNQGLDNGGNKITNVAAGTANTDAVNVKQLKDKVTTVTSDGSITVTDTNTDPTKGHAYNLKVNSQGVVNNAQTPVVYTKEDGTKVYLVNGKFYDNPQGNGAEVPKAQVIASMNNGGNSTTTPMKLNNVGSSIANETGATFLDKLDSAKANTPNGAVNVSDLKSTADAIGEKGLNFGTQSTGANSEIHKNLGEKLEIVGGGTKADDEYDASNIKTMTKDGKVVIALDKNIKADSVTVGEKGQPGVPGKNGMDGKIGVNGKDGSAVVINGKDGSIGLNGKDGANGITIKGDKGVDGVDGVNGTNGITRIVYQDKDGNNHEVATHDDGMKFAGDDGQTNQDTNPKVIKKHLNKVVDIVGGADKTKLTDNNIGVNNDGGKLRVQLANELSGITKISNGNSSISIADVPAGATTPAVTISGGNLSMGDNKITNVKAGTNDTDAVNYKQLKDSRTTVTSQDGSVTITPTQNGDSTNYDLKVNPPLDPRVDQLAEEVGRVGAQGAALAALKPIQYDPLEPTQIMAGYGNYRGNSAIAMGVAHYKNESTLIHGGVSWAGGSSHMMANAGVTWKVGNRDSEAAVADRYRKGPISSTYAMQQEMAAMKAQNAGLKGEVSDLKAENEQMKAQIAAMMAKLGL